MKKNIKALFTDVDGTLTDGSLIYGAYGEELKIFNVKDGKGLHLWMDSGRIGGIISAKSSPALTARIRDLKIEHFGQGIENKAGWLDNWLKQNNVGWKQLAYIGDDLNDLPVMQKCGISAAPADAVAEILKIADFKCTLSGGKGCVREFIDFLLE